LADVAHSQQKRWFTTSREVSARLRTEQNRRKGCRVHGPSKRLNHLPDLSVGSARTMLSSPACTPRDPHDVLTRKSPTGGRRPRAPRKSDGTSKNFQAFSFIVFFLGHGRKRGQFHFLPSHSPIASTNADRDSARPVFPRNMLPLFLFRPEKGRFCCQSSGPTGRR